MKKVLKALGFMAAGAGIAAIAMTIRDMLSVATMDELEEFLDSKNDSSSESEEEDEDEDIGHLGPFDSDFEDEFDFLDDEDENMEEEPGSETADGSDESDIKEDDPFVKLEDAIPSEANSMADWADGVAETESEEESEIGKIQKDVMDEMFGKKGADGTPSYFPSDDKSGEEK